jgi:hypothetical protein
LALDSGAAGDCRGCDLVLHEEEKRHDNGLRSGWSEPDGSGNDDWNDNDRNNRRDDPPAGPNVYSSKDDKGPKR